MRIKELLFEVKLSPKDEWKIIKPLQFRKITKQLYYKQFAELKKHSQQDLLNSLLSAIIRRYHRQHDDVANTLKKTEGELNTETLDNKLSYVSNIVRHIVDEGQPIAIGQHTLWDKTTKIDNFTIYAWLIRSLLFEHELNLHDVINAKGEVQSFINDVRNDNEVDWMAYFVNYETEYPWSLHDVLTIVDNAGLGSSKPNEEMAKKDLEGIIKSGDAGIIFKNNQFTLYKPRSQQASCVIGYDTTWCTAYGYKYGRYPGRTQNQWNNYTRKGNFYIFDFNDGESIFGIYLGQEITEYKNKKNVELNKTEKQLLANAVQQLPKDTQQMLSDQGLDLK